jgi:polar amino acid transport system substrate-binding protein
MATKKLKIAITKTTPFVIEKKGGYTGFEIELWELIAKDLGLSFEYAVHNFQKLIPLVASKKADVALAAITIKEEREEIVDFSHPTFNSGLKILLSKNRANIDFIATVKSFIMLGYKQLVKPFLVLLLIILTFGNVLWLVEKSSGSFYPNYFPGVFQAIWLSLCTIIGSDGGLFVYSVNSWPGRAILTIGQITNLAVLGLIIGELTAFITTRKIRLNISGQEDLKGKTVATVKDTTSEQILKNIGASVVPTDTIEKAFEKLKKNHVEAVVFDAPVLTYYALNEGADWSEVVGDLFDAQEYGIVLQEGSSLRKQINLALLTIKENGSYDALYKKWFGENS